MSRLFALSAFVLALALVLAAAASAAPHRSARTLAPITHVVMVMEENHSQSAAMHGMPYLVSLGHDYADTTNLKAITHPSLPNYFAVTSGSTQGRTNDCGSSTNGCRTGANNIYHQQGSAWAQWSESMPTPCDHNNASPYVVHHAIPPFYTDLDATCKARDVPLHEDQVPPIGARFTFITPNNNHNAHDGSLAAADGWLHTVVPQLMGDPAYQNGSTVIEITFDEGSGGDNTVYTVLINPRLHQATVTKPLTHYSTLRLNEALLGDPLLGAAKSAASYGLLGH